MNVRTIRLFVASLLMLCLVLPTPAISIMRVPADEELDDDVDNGEGPICGMVCVFNHGFYYYESWPFGDYLCTYRSCYWHKFPSTAVCRYMCTPFGPQPV